MTQQPPENETSSGINPHSAIFYACRALWGEVSPALRAMAIDWDEKFIYLFFYYDGEISEEDIESAECACTEIIADFWEHYEFDLQILRLDAPQKIPERGCMVYRRRE